MLRPACLSSPAAGRRMRIKNTQASASAPASWIPRRKLPLRTGSCAWSAPLQSTRHRDHPPRQRQRRFPLSRTVRASGDPGQARSHPCACFAERSRGFLRERHCECHRGCRPADPAAFLISEPDPWLHRCSHDRRMADVSARADAEGAAPECQRCSNYGGG